MTSEEALDHLMEYFKDFEDMPAIMQEELNIISKDLERLNVIKKHLEVVGLSISCFISGNHYAEGFYEPTFEELKEWVKSEKEN